MNNLPKVIIMYMCKYLSFENVNAFCCVSKRMYNYIFAYKVQHYYVKLSKLHDDAYMKKYTCFRNVIIDICGESGHIMGIHINILKQFLNIMDINADTSRKIHHKNACSICRLYSLKNLSTVKSIKLGYFCHVNYNLLSKCMPNITKLIQPTIYNYKELDNNFSSLEYLATDNDIWHKKDHNIICKLTKLKKLKTLEISCFGNIYVNLSCFPNLSSFIIHYFGLHDIVNVFFEPVISHTIKKIKLVSHEYLSKLKANIVLKELFPNLEC